MCPVLTVSKTLPPPGSQRFHLLPPQAVPHKVARGRLWAPASGLHPCLLGALHASHLTQSKSSNPPWGPQGPPGSAPITSVPLPPPAQPHTGLLTVSWTHESHSNLQPFRSFCLKCSSLVPYMVPPLPPCGLYSSVISSVGLSDPLN